MNAALSVYKQHPDIDLHEDLGEHDSAEIIVQKVFRTAIQAWRKRWPSST